jgi:hypothetical protein
VACLLAVSIVPLLGIAAIALDGGLLLSDRRGAQRAADAAALAAAVDLFNNYTTNKGVDVNGTAAKSAITTAAANGFPNNGTTSTVTVHIPPKSGGFASDPGGYAEVVISYNESRYFSRIWGSSNIPVTARAVAHGEFTPANPGVLVLDPTDNNTLDVTASGNVTVTGHGSINVNSKSANGGATMTNTGNIVADNINLSDGVYNHSNSGNMIGSVHYNVPPTPDPLAGLPQPTQPAYPQAPAPTTGLNYSTSQGVNYSGTDQLALYPGYYEGISVTGSGSVTLLPNSDGTPGIYYLGSHGLSITNAGGVLGSNVMLYSDGGANTSITGSGSVILSPPTSGTYQGITYFQARSSNKDVNITAQGNLNMSGTFYAAGAKVSITGQGDYSNSIGSQWIAWQMAVTGSGSFTVNYKGEASPVRTIQLIE